MCDMYGHGFSYEVEGRREILFDFEVNSHSRIAEYRKIPQGAKRIGFDPVNGEPVTNDSTPLTEEEKEKISLLFNMYFPDRKSLVGWIRKNYAKNNDAYNWNVNLLKLLQCQDLFSAKRCQDIAKWCQDEAKRCQDEAKWCQDIAKWCQDEAKRCQDEALSASDVGRFDNMDFNAKNDEYLEAVLELFDRYPNEYWKDRVEERKVEYRDFVVV